MKSFLIYSNVTGLPEWDEQRRSVSWTLTLLGGGGGALRLRGGQDPGPGGKQDACCRGFEKWKRPSAFLYTVERTDRWRRGERKGEGPRRKVCENVRRRVRRSGGRLATVEPRGERSAVSPGHLGVSWAVSCNGFLWRWVGGLMTAMRRSTTVGFVATASSSSLSFCLIYF